MPPWPEKTHANTFAWEKNCSAPRSQVFKLVMAKFPLWGNEDKKASVPLAKRMEALRHKDCYLYNQCAPYKLTFPELPLLRVYAMAIVVPPPQQWKYSYPRCLALSHYAREQTPSPYPMAREEKQGGQHRRSVADPGTKAELGAPRAPTIAAASWLHLYWLLISHFWSVHFCQHPLPTG